MPLTTGINHVATLTPDMDRLVRFYTEAFEAKVTFEMVATEEQPRIVVLDLDGWDSRRNLADESPTRRGDVRPDGGAQGPVSPRPW